MYPYCKVLLIYLYNVPVLTGNIWTGSIPGLQYIALGLKQRDLAEQYGVPQSTVSRIILTCIHFLYSVLGSPRIWMTKDIIKECLPSEFEDYPDTTTILDSTKLRCQTPTFPLLQSEVYSNYKCRCTLKGMIGIAPHGAVTFFLSFLLSQ